MDGSTVQAGWQPASQESKQNGVQPRAAAGPGTGAVAAAALSPPLGNTGAGNTLALVIDWLEVTFQALAVRDVLALLTPSGTGLDEWTPLECGRHGYKQGFIRGLVRVYFDGAEGMGVHVAASGKGLRQLEAEGVIRSWEGPDGFAALVRSKGGKASRADYAFDDRSGAISPEMVQQAVDEGRCVSRWKTATPRACVNLKDGTPGGWSLYFGSGKSRMMGRFYDKAAEQAAKGVAVEGPWMRFEVQARDERADLVLRLVEEGQRILHLTLTPAQALAGLLWSYIDFKERGVDSNRSRWETCAWWSALLNVPSKVSAQVATVYKTVAELAQWFQRQVSATYAVLLMAKGYGQEWFDDLVFKAVHPDSCRLKRRHWGLVGLGGAGTG